MPWQALIGQCGNWWASAVGKRDCAGPSAARGHTEGDIPEAAGEGRGELPIGL